MLGSDGRFRRDLLTPAVHEVDATASLLDTGLDLVMEQGVSVHDPSSMFATLATGAEKLLKLGVGLMSIDDTGAWPSADTMRSTYKHEIALMHRLTLEGMKRRALKAPPFLLERVDAVAGDIRLTRILGCLDDYAKYGRFHHLDTLAGKPPPDPSPRERWERVVRDILDVEPEILAALGSPEFKTLGHPRLNRLLADSLIRWWALHHLVWMRGEFGKAAQLLSAQLGLPRKLDERARHLI